MELNMKATEKMIYRMALELKYGRIIANMKAFIKMVKNMDLECIVEMMALDILEIGEIIK